MSRLVLLRHGASEWNESGRFAGWIDVPLTPTGVEQARHAGDLMRQNGFEFGVCCTSVLKRAAHTAWHCLDAMDRTWLPILRSWRLNERHYGALQGLSKSDAVTEYGQEQVRLWRRSYAIAPPPASAEQVRALAADLRYASVDVPVAESLQDAVARLLPFWEETMLPARLSGEDILMVGHGTSLRAMLRIVCNVSKSNVGAMEIPNAMPLVFELDAHGKAKHCLILRHDGYAIFDS